jgi:hypothetical protein
MLTGFRALLLAAVLMPSALFAQGATPAATPPMGWNSWNLFASKVNVRLTCPGAPWSVHGPKKTGEAPPLLFSKSDTPTPNSPIHPEPPQQH